jgi:hypothetical protein
LKPKARISAMYWFDMVRVSSTLLNARDAVAAGCRCSGQFRLGNIPFSAMM